MNEETGELRGDRPRWGRRTLVYVGIVIVALLVALASVGLGLVTLGGAPGPVAAPPVVTENEPLSKSATQTTRTNTTETTPDDDIVEAESNPEVSVETEAEPDSEADSDTPVDAPVDSDDEGDRDLDDRRDLDNEGDQATDEQSDGRNRGDEGEQDEDEKADAQDSDGNTVNFRDYHGKYEATIPDSSLNETRTELVESYSVSLDENARLTHFTNDPGIYVLRDDIGEILVLIPVVESSVRMTFLVNGTDGSGTQYELYRTFVPNMQVERSDQSFGPDTISASDENGSVVFEYEAPDEWDNRSFFVDLRDREGEDDEEGIDRCEKVRDGDGFDLVCYNEDGEVISVEDFEVPRPPGEPCGDNYEVTATVEVIAPFSGTGDVDVVYTTDRAGQFVVRTVAEPEVGTKDCLFMHESAMMEAGDELVISNRGAGTYTIEWAKGSGDQAEPESTPTNEPTETSTEEMTDTPTPSPEPTATPTPTATPDPDTTPTPIPDDSTATGEPEPTEVPDGSDESTPTSSPPTETEKAAEPEPALP